MKKRILSLLLAVVLVIGLFPVTMASAISDTDQIVTVEKYDENGNGTFLLPPKRVTRSTTSYAYRWIQNAVGSGNISIEDYSYITAYVDSSQEDGWLNNGDINGSSKWLASVNGTCYDDVSYFYGSEIDVLRIIFSPSGNGSEFALSNPGWADLGTMAVNKDSLIELASRYSASDFNAGSASLAAYQAAMNTILDLDATAQEVSEAKAALENALANSASGISLSENGASVDSLAVSVGHSKTLTAVLTPSTATDPVTWMVGDESIATVTQNGIVTGVAAGTTTLTARVSANVSVTIDVTVSAVAVETVTVQDVEMNVRDIRKLTATVIPEDASGKLEWNVADATIAAITEDGILTALAAGETTVTATFGEVSGTAKVTVYDSPYVYFEYTNGTKQYMAADGSFTLGALDEGFFRVANTGATPWWENEEKIDAGSGSVTYHWYVNRETGEWQPSGVAPTKPITVTAGTFTKTFTINYEPTSGITALKTYINGAEVTNDDPYEVTGCISNVAVTTKGLKNGAWIDVPVQALNYDTSDNVYYNFRFVGNCLEINRAGSATMTVSLKGESVSTTFKVVCNPVMATAMEVIVPDTFAISDWDAVPDQYVGLRPFSEGGYNIEFTPANATNRDVIWTALTPEIAEHFSTHSAGIVPKKAGTASFTVTNASDPTLTQEVTVTFVYANPLTAASAQDLEMKVNTAQELTINVTPGNATEQRFTWTYSTDGVVEVSDRIRTDESGTTSWTTHEIKALKEGTVRVTGTPWDTTGFCKAVSFTVTVTGEGGTPEDVDYLAMAKDDIAHGLAYLASQDTDNFGDEWTIFTILRAGGSISAANQAAYLASVKSALSSGETLKTNDYVRLVLTLGVMGEDPTNFEGHDLVAQLYNNTNLANETYNMSCWTLIALDSMNYEIPANAKWNRETLVNLILGTQLSDGGFGWDNSASDVDMTGMVLQALAPYTSDSKVQAALQKALAYLKNEITANCGYAPYGVENSCTAAQVLTALASDGIDPVSEAGFTFSAKNLITNLHQFRNDVKGGFNLNVSSASSDAMSTYQTTCALEAYRRFAEKENRLYDLTYLLNLQTVSILPSVNGSVTVDKDRAVPGDTVTVTVGPDTGYELSKLTVNDRALTVTDGQATFIMPEGGAILEAAFVKSANAAGAVADAMDGLRVRNAKKAAYDAIEEIQKAYDGLTAAEKLEIRQAYLDFQEKVDAFENYLDEEIQNALNDLADYYLDLDENDYSEKNWDEIEAIYKQAKKDIKAGAYEEEVEAVLKAALAEMKKVPEGGEIEVTFRLIGDFQHDNGTADHETYVTWIETTDYTLDAGSTVYDLFVEALDDAGLGYKGASSNYVTEIQAPAILGGYWLGQLDNGKNSGWMYSVNGAHPTVGLKNYELEDGDKVIWHYVDDYATEESKYTWLEAKDYSPEKFAEAHLDEILTVGKHGEAEPDEIKLTDLGKTVTFKFIPDDGYEVKDVKIDGVSKGSITSYTYKNLTIFSRIEVEFCEAGSLDFYDVKETDWFYDDVRYVVSADLFNGTGDRTFSPNTSMTRAMLVTVLYRLEGEPKVTGTSSFTDVSRSQWYTNAVTWAEKNEIVNGTGGTQFAPNSSVTREQMAAILYRYAEYKGYDVSDSSSLTGYSDYGQISAYALKPLKWANAEGLITGRTATTLAPKGTATRAEVAAILHRFVENVVN